MDEALSVADQIQQQIAASLPDAVIRAEHSRRFQPKGGGWLIAGRPKKLRPCPECGALFGAREMVLHRREHRTITVNVECEPVGPVLTVDHPLESMRVTAYDVQGMRVTVERVPHANTPE